MYLLELLLPPIFRRYKLPLTRDQIMLLMVAINELFLGVDHFLAHKISGTIRPWEMFPIYFGLSAGTMLLIAGLIAVRYRNTASVIATLTLAVSIVVGLIGWKLHIMRAILPNAPVGEQISLHKLVWAVPFIAPLTSSFVGVLGISAAWLERPADSGRLVLVNRARLQLPFSKTQAYFFLIGMGTMACVISSVLDHARSNFENPWLWLPNIIGIFGIVACFLMGVIDRPTKTDLLTFVGAMAALILVGMVGSVLHLQNDYIAGGYSILTERLIRGAPPLAPLLFSDMGALGLIVLLDPREIKHRKEPVLDAPEHD